MLFGDRWLVRSLPLVAEENGTNDGLQCTLVEAFRLLLKLVPFHVPFDAQP